MQGLQWTGPVLAAALAVVVALGVALLRSRKGARAAAYRYGQLLGATGATTPDWLWEGDRGGRFSYCSPGVEGLLGYPARDLLGATMADLLYDDASRRAALARMSEPIGWWGLELRWRHRDGHPVTLAGSAVPLLDSDGRHLGFRGTHRPVADIAPDRPAVAEARERLDVLLRLGGIRTALQPIVDLQSGEVSAVEALARFPDGRGPEQWFHDAALGHRTRQLDELVFRTALGVLPELPAGVDLSVNAGPELLVDPGFRAGLLGSGADLRRLVIEITEHTQVTDYAELRAAIASLREHRVRFAIDDTGAGYASLVHVIQLAPDVIKLDRSLIGDLERDRARRAMVTALVLVALEVGATVTGEGVETADQLDCLRTLGVDHAQGFHLARPSTDPDAWAGWFGRSAPPQRLHRR